MAGRSSALGKTLVTGATGFTGGRLAERLVQAGADVVSFVRSTSDTAALRELGVECRVVDIRDRREVLANFGGVDRVFHLAAAYRSEHASRDEFHAVNVTATGNLLEAAVQGGVRRFVHCSTVGVQGAIDDPPATEEYRTRPGDHYQESKLEGERRALDAFRQGLPGTVVRPVGIYGPRDTRFLKLFKAIERGRFVMLGTGATLYHLTYIDDLVDGFFLAAEQQAALGQVFTIAGPEYTSIRELVNRIAGVLGRNPPRWRVPYLPVYAASVVCDALCRAVGVDPPLYPRRVEFFRLDRAFSTDKAQQLLGYRPKVTLAEGLGRTAAWYRAEGLL